MTLSASLNGHAAGHASGSRVFVIDDDPAVRNSLKFSLETEGYSVSAFPNAHDLLAVHEMPAQGGCLVIDYVLPDMNGLELLDRLRKKGWRTPAVLITSNPGPILRYRVSQAGAQIVEKPLLGNALAEAIRKAVDGRLGAG